MQVKTLARAMVESNIYTKGAGSLSPAMASANTANAPARLKRQNCFLDLRAALLTLLPPMRGIANPDHAPYSIFSRRYDPEARYVAACHG